MIARDSFPDDVPVADAVEQNRLAAESADPDNGGTGDRTQLDDDVPPLETNETDWREQHQVIEDSDQDEFR